MTETIIKGNLEYTRKSETGRSQYHVRLVRCPVCAEPFGENDGAKRMHHLASHSPEDFGFTPL